MRDRNDKAMARSRQNSRLAALARPELRGELSAARVAPTGPLSAPIKQVDAATRAMIDEALKKKGKK